jgi:hemoglobin-like flavoprotein
MKLVQTLSVVIEALDRFEDLTPTLHALGQRHSAYGAVAQHYELVEEALVWAVGQVLGAGPGSEVLSAWRSLLRRVSAAMLDGVRMLAEGAPTEVA